MAFEEDDLERAGTRSRRQTSFKPSSLPASEYHAKTSRHVFHFSWKKMALFCLFLLTLFLIVRRPKQTKKKNKQTIIQFEENIVYPDAFQLADNELFHRVFSVDKKVSSYPTIQSTDVIREGHTFDQLRRLVNQGYQQKHRVPVTAIIHAKTPAQLFPQLQAVLTQTALPEHVWVLCSVESQREIEARIMSLDQRRVKVMVLSEKGALSWIRVTTQAATDYVWLLDQDVTPGKRYLEHLLKLYQTPAYQSTLLGTEAMSLEPSFLCYPHVTEQQQRTRQVDAINDSWLLHRSWVSILLAALDHTNHTLPSMFISQTLWMSAGIPSIVLPTDPIERAYWGDVRLRAKTTEMTSTCQQANMTHIHTSHQPSVLFYLDSPRALDDLMPLICQFNQLSTVDVHLITHQSVTVDCHKPVWIHWIDLLYQNPDWLQFKQLPTQWTRVLDSIQPKLMIHTSLMMRTMQTMINVTNIYLPSQEIPHALWMADLTLETLSKWHQMDIKLIVTTDKKPHALSRLLTSASEAHYLGDSVDLSVLMDASSDRLTHTFAHRFSWSHGQKSMRHRIAHSVSKASLFVESWYPSHRHEYAILLQQDLELSPLFYSWAKYSILKYRFESVDQSLFGISLYAPRLIETDPSGRHLFHQRPRSDYLMQWPSYLGAVYFPEHWREFHDYITARQTDTLGMALQSVVVPNLRSNDWIKSWRRYFEELVYLRGYVMLYPQESLVTVHMELKKKYMTQFGQALSLYQVPLANKTGQLDSLESLPVLDIWGRPTDRKTLEARGQALHQQVSACLPSTEPEDRFDPMDLLCPFAKIVSVQLEHEDDPIPTLLPKEINVYS
ncbi:hypothetical protein BD560DRAFT_395178 [Blakeslea trispora]|nr:hypothetical protein BD560DRAFT_395178 [Blakeslea trispora]